MFAEANFSPSSEPATDGVLFVARFGHDERRRVENACRRTGHRAVVVAAPSVCRELLESDAVRPAGVFLDLSLGGAKELVAWIRGNPRWCSLSVVALARHPTEGAFVDAHAAGVDDVTLRSDLGAVTRRLAALGTDSVEPGAPTQGRAWVAHPSEQRRVIAGRVLHQAGLDVAFASSTDELIAGIEADPRAALLVIAEALLTPDDGIITAFRERAGAADLPVVILDVESETEHAGGTNGHLGVVADAAAPDNLLFVVNELGSRLGGELRASQRLLYSTLCAFRRASDVSPEFGLTYNISRDGLYVRTVDPPAAQTSVWLELRPPGTTTIVHLRGLVVWTQPAAKRGRTTVPAGFGVRILERECPPADLERYRTAYQVFREEPRPYLIDSQPPLESQSSPSDRPRVLVVDDEERTLRVYRRLLGDAYDVVTASDGIDAIEKFSRSRFDVVLTDIEMPGLDGLGVLKRVHELRPLVPVVIATGMPTVDSAIGAVEHGAFRYLTKPFDRETLLSTLDRAIQLARLARLKQDALRLHAETTGRIVGPGLRETFERALDQLYMVYQPIISWRERKILGYEALVRSFEPAMRHPGLLFPAAERLGEVTTLGRTIRAMSPTPFLSRNERLFINLTANDLSDDEILHPDSPLASIAHRVTFEVTERASLESIPNVIQRIADLRAMGFTIAIDDLGAGYAGLSSFAQLEPEVAKLDMSLVRDVHRVPTKQRLVRSFQEVCSDLGIVLVCEGVETPEERDCLVEQGCDVFQGFLFGRPEQEPGPAIF